MSKFKLCEEAGLDPMDMGFVPKCVYAHEVEAYLLAKQIPKGDDRMSEVIELLKSINASLDCLVERGNDE